MKKHSAMAILGVALFSVGAHAEGTKVDVKPLMDATGLNYHVSDSGNGVATFTLDGDRSQIVYYTTRVTKIGGTTLHEVWSSAGQIGKEVPAEDLISLLEAGADEPIGTWALEETDGGYLVYFSARVPENLAPKDLRKVLERVAVVTDAKEATLSDKDEN